MKIRILGELNKKTLKELSDTFSLDNKLIYLFSGHSEREIRLNQKFSKVLIDNNKIEIDFYLRFITQVYMKPLNTIDIGWRHIIGLETSEKGILLLRQNIEEIRNWDEWNKTITLLK